ncbi:MAG: hypothetical protein JOZ24_05020, partial [Candidatus Eremiobacteraeota bacterium]|nr:hypothetical protein [Candidatus Eremiobacteraeota bacterium]
PDAFTTFDNPGGGHIIAGTLGNASLASATAVVLRRIHAQFGARPNIVEIGRNPSANTLALIFTALKGGTSYTGLSVITGASGAQTGGAILYDTSSRFNSTIGPMLQRLGVMTSADTGAGTGRAAPPEALIPHPFSDGTGTFGVPADWKVSNASGGSASAEGPTGEIVSYNLALGATDPSNPAAQRYYNGLPPGYRQTALNQTLLLPYTGDPVRAWTTAFVALSNRNGRPAPALSVQSTQDMSTGAVRLAEITGTGTIPGIAGKRDDEPGNYVAFAQVTPPNGMGQWMMYFTFVYVPTRRLAEQGRTAAAVLESVRINVAALNAQLAAIRNMFQAKFDQMMANSVAFNARLRASTDRFLANQAATEEEMHKQAVGMENIVLGRSVVVDENTGQHIEINKLGGGFLVYPGSPFHVVPPSELLRGVDY